MFLDKIQEAPFGAKIKKDNYSMFIVFISLFFITVRWECHAQNNLDSLNSIKHRQFEQRK